VDYRETEPPERLRPFVKTAWSLDAGGEAGQWLSHKATPDGCVEIIRRLAGTSAWGEAQPAAFVAGLVTAPAELRLSGDSRFVALRIWPWTWNAIARLRAPLLVDRWAALGDAAPDFDMPATADEALDALAERLRGCAPPELAAAILHAESPAELSRLGGRPPRALQRWFEREIGVPPRTYLRALRFQQTFAGLAGSGDSLADHAAAHGFADQAHMAREFRALAGQPASRARRRAQPPFL
jgi:AraC-like DNA-binding protein